MIIPQGFFKFFSFMSNKYLKKVKDYGHTWTDCDLNFLENRLRQEMDEYRSNSDPEELIDIANVCCMLYLRKTVNDSFNKENLKVDI